MSRNQLLLVARHWNGRFWWPVLVAQALWGAVALRHGCGFAWARGKWQGIFLFSAARKQNLPGEAAALQKTLQLNESFIRIESTDAYWKLYFLLTGGAK
jgi:hypothetical protein